MRQRWEKQIHVSGQETDSPITPLQLLMIPKLDVAVNDDDEPGTISVQRVCFITLETAPVESSA